MSVVATGTALAAESLSAGYGDALVLDRLDLQVQAGALTAVVGPNGCGKSTLLRTLGRLLARRGGRVVLDGRALDEFRPRELARRLAVLPQEPVAPEGITVAELVARGRHPHRSWWGTDPGAGHVEEALRWTHLEDLAGRRVDELSGGQRQRAWIAMALAQDADVLLLDEPTSALDVAHAVEVLDLLDTLHDERGTTVVVVLHDLNLAARYADRLVVMSAGAVAAEGRPADVLEAGLLRRVFGIDCRVVTDPVSGGPLVVPIGARHVLPEFARRPGAG